MCTAHFTYFGYNPVVSILMFATLIFYTFVNVLFRFVPNVNISNLLSTTKSIFFFLIPFTSFKTLQVHLLSRETVCMLH